MSGSQARRHATGQQQVISTGRVHLPGADPGGVPGPPKNIAAHRSLDRAAGILCDDQPTDAFRL